MEYNNYGGRIKQNFLVTELEFNLLMSVNKESDLHKDKEDQDRNSIY